MRSILAPASRPVLARLARERTLCAFDFDGTLAPIVAHPEEAVMRARTALLLSRLAASYPCAIVSGRARADLASRIGGVPVETLIGNHGAESGTSAARARQTVEQWRALLEPALRPLDGVWVEDKGLSLAVHYRQAAHPVAARRSILRTAGSLGQVRLLGGKKVVNLTVVGSPDKGDAVNAERMRLGCDWVLFVGDDKNDEDAFALPGNTVAVRVGRNPHSRAGYYLRSQAEIDALIEILISLREAGQPSG